jgi:hypothetical protein
MAKTTFKAVALFDPETQGYRPSAHNLPADHAVGLAQSFTADGRNAKVIDQERRHRTSDPWKCKPCKQAAGKLTEPSETTVQSSDAPASQE